MSHKSSSSPADSYLVGHLNRLNKLAQSAQQKAAKETSTDVRAGNRLAVGDQVLVRSHPLGRNKIQDHFKQEPRTVLQVPPASGGPYVISDGDKSKRVSGRQIRRYRAPTEPAVLDDVMSDDPGELLQVPDVLTTDSADLQLQQTDPDDELPLRTALPQPETERLRRQPRRQRRRPQRYRW